MSLMTLLMTLLPSTHHDATVRQLPTRRRTPVRVVVLADRAQRRARRGVAEVEEVTVRGGFVTAVDVDAQGRDHVQRLRSRTLQAGGSPLFDAGADLVAPSTLAAFQSDRRVVGHVEHAVLGVE